MGAAKYNGVILPELPNYDKGIYPHAFICKELEVEDSVVYDRYVLWLSSEPFVFFNRIHYIIQGVPSGDDDYIGVPKTANTAGYYFTPKKTSWRWNLGEVQNTEGNLDDGMYAHCLASKYLWSERDIPEKDNATNVVYNGSEPVKVIVQAPVITSLTGGGTYKQGDLAEPLTCTAVSPDGGTLSYAWRRNGLTYWQNNSCTPFTNVVGVHEYACTVYNSLYGETASAASETITVTVKAEQSNTQRDKKAPIVGYVLNLCGVPMAELIAEMLCKGKSAVSTSLYLYGVPSDDGNIGLRVGDTVTYYKGAVLPNVNTVYTNDLKAHFPNAFVYLLDSGEYRLYATPNPAYMYWDFSGKKERVSTATASNHQYVRLYTQNGGTSWEVREIPAYSESGYAVWCDADKVIWCNHRIYYPDDYSHDATLAGTLKFAATEPIPVSGIVDTIDGIPIYE